MQLKIKSALLLTIALLLGVIIGMLINTRIINNKFDRMRENLFAGKLLINEIEEYSQPDENQKEEVQALVKKYRPKFRELAVQSRLHARELVDSLATELKDVLTEDQYENLQNSVLFKRGKIRDQFSK